MSGPRRVVNHLTMEITQVKDTHLVLLAQLNATEHNSPPLNHVFLRFIHATLEYLRYC